MSSITVQTPDGIQEFKAEIKYDSMLNLLAFPMSVESIGIGQSLILDGVFGYCVTFLPYAFSWCRNNVTTLLSGTGQCTFTYDQNRYPLTKTVQ